MWDAYGRRLHLDLGPNQKEHCGLEVQIGTGNGRSLCGHEFVLAQVKLTIIFSTMHVNGITNETQQPSLWFRSSDSSLWTRGQKHIQR